MNIFCKINQSESSESIPEKSPSNINSISSADLKKLLSVEYKSQTYASFYTTAMEKDKSILTLSVAGIGFLVTLLKLASYLNIYDMVFFFVAAVSYLSAIFLIITLFSKNASYVIDLVNDRDTTLKNFELMQLDKWAIRSFYLAIVMSLLMAISTSSALFLERNKEMTNENKETTQKLVIDGNSYAQASDLKKSYQGASAMQPGSGVPSTTQSQPASEQQTGAAAMRPDITEDN
ncbi:hypothetical protein [Pseudoalteromonas prydzensis]|uniref:hypothetical protein n=1 Tax=Pseudoalteromonas prydzensis TaxID=182141 RepID=UPI0007E50AF1|nr:hypothetical protein [Pseudoalteromonas prydzensis]MBE0379223.1 hypothetical protein [Pseudoalteromonas prydzensis ACAM 620]